MRRAPSPSYPGTRRVDLPAASPAPPLRPATRPPAPPQPDPVPVRAEPLTAEPLSADGTQLLHRYVPAKEMLDREDRGAPVRRPPTLPKHPPRAVVRRRRVRRRLLEWPFLIVFALLSAYLIRAYVVQTFYIPSGSMHETLLEGDRVLVNKVGYHLHEVSRGDVVVFRRPPDFPVEDEDLIKRVVALPGETVEGRGGQVYVDGRALRESYVEPRCSGTEAFAPRHRAARHAVGDGRQPLQLQRQQGVRAGQPGPAGRPRLRPRLAVRPAVLALRTLPARDLAVGRKITGRGGGADGGAARRSGPVGPAG